jgi:hypothetical protein
MTTFRERSGYAMTESNVVEFRNPEEEIEDALTQALHAGARKLLAQAVGLPSTPSIGTNRVEGMWCVTTTYRHVRPKQGSAPSRSRSRGRALAAKRASVLALRLCRPTCGAPSA